MGRRKGTGCIVARPNAEGLVRGYWTDDVRRRHWVSGHTVGEVDAKLAQQIGEYSRGLRTVRRPETVAEYLGRWLTDKRGTVKDSTWQRHEEHCRLHIAPVIGHLHIRDNLIPPLKELQRVLIASVQAGGHGLSYGSVKGVRRTLHAALEDARNDGTIARDFNPLRAVPALTDPGPARDPVLLDDSLVQHILQAARDVEPWWFPCFALLATTGIDVGTAMAARRDDYDPETGQLRVRRSVRRVWGGLVTTSPKRSQRNRDLPLPDDVNLLLAAHLDRVDEARAEAAEAGEPWPAETADLLFPREDGAQKDPGVLSNHNWQRVLKHAGLQARSVRLKDFRSTVASVLLEEGHEEALIQKIIGHSLRTSTLRQHYLAAREAVRRKALTTVSLRLLPSPPEVPSTPSVGEPDVRGSPRARGRRGPPASRRRYRWASNRRTAAVVASVVRLPSAGSEPLP
jgi:integrase